jgi:hypothetical protein
MSKSDISDDRETKVSQNSVVVVVNEYVRLGVATMR